MALEMKIEKRGVVPLLLPHPASRGNLRIQWLGQAGFLIDSGYGRIIIDPYLSDSLAIKYEGGTFPHKRMMPAPVDPSAIGSLKLYLSTHHHSDHMDETTINRVVPNNDDCFFVVPSASAKSQKLAAVPKDRIVPADAFASVRVGEFMIYPIPSAHEKLTIDDAGHHVYLGYVISIGGITIYHSGDCIPYAGLVDNLSAFHIDIALLPVNGRDNVREKAGILGNFSLEEAMQLAVTAGFSFTIGHHFGMFDFNTIDVVEAERAVQNRARTHFTLAEMGNVYEFC
jgi:L-ascorbate metabolism protein UlaG (beta-lactamase superfamily)